jgi:hypothetical protein
LSTPLTMITSSIASVLNLFATQTGQINIGASSSTLSTPLSLITGSLVSVLNLFATQTGQINLGASSSTLVVPNTVRSTSGTAQTLFTNQTQNITLGGSSVPALNHISSSLNLNSTNATANTVLIGSNTTSASSIVGTNVNVNSTNSSANTIDIGSASSIITDLGSTININSTNIVSNTINIGSSTSVINSWPIKPALTAYNATNGTNIVGSIGYIYRGSANTGSFPNSSLQPSGTITDVPVGVYYVSATVAIDTTTVGQITYQQYSLDDGVGTNTFAMTGIASGTAPGNCVDRIYYGNVSGCICLTTTSTLRVRSFWQFTSGTFTRSANSFNFTAVRIA